MAVKKATTKSTQKWRELLAEDSDWLRGLVQQVVQEVLEAEMDEALQAGKGERTASRLGYRAGYYGRTLVTRVGKLELRVPQDRKGRFSTEVFDRYQRSEKALVSALAEMYVQGVSTRKVKAVTEELCGHAFSASTISQINKKLDRQLATFAEVFEYVALYGPRSRLEGASGGNVILLASDEPFPAEAILAANRAHGGNAILAAGPEQVGPFIEGALVLTDDFAPADQLLTRFG